MTPETDKAGCEQSELVALLAIGALPPKERMAVEAHVASCSLCQQELASLQRVTESFASWPTDILRPSAPLWDRLAQRIARETGAAPTGPLTDAWQEPEWKRVAPGIWCKFLSRDNERGRISMLVRLAPGAEYPSHRHAEGEGEELHLLDGELWINDRKLRPGDFNRAEPGTRDWRVWSETGCTCVLMTSLRDVLC